MDFDDHAESTIGRLIQATFGLWNALLTVNGIMLTVFTAVYAIAPAGGTYLVRLLITCCVVRVPPGLQPCGDEVQLPPHGRGDGGRPAEADAIRSASGTCAARSGDTEP
jgi:hypothetical protein